LFGANKIYLLGYDMQIIDGQRELRGLPPVAEWVEPKHIDTAAGLGLGTMDQNEMQVIRLTVKDVGSKDKKPAMWGEIKTTEY